MDGQTDRQADRQGQILMPPDYRHGGIIHKLYSVKCDEWTDGQTDRQGQILMPPDYCHAGIKKPNRQEIMTDT